MLGKLIKYDFISYIKSLSMVFVIAIITTIFSMIVGHFYFDNIFYKFILVILYIATGISITATMIMPLFVSIKRFQENVLKDQGYLTNTLPVKKSTIVLSKLISSTTIVLGCSLITLFLILLATNSLDETFVGLLRDINNGFNQYGSWYILMGVFFVIMTILGASILQAGVFASLTLGYAQDRNKFLFSCLFAIGLYLLYTLVSVIGIFIVMAAGESVSSVDLSNVNEGMAVTLVFLLFDIYLGFFVGLFSYISVKTLEKKLNLE